VVAGRLNVGSLQYLSYYECCDATVDQYKGPSGDNTNVLHGGLRGDEPGMNLGHSNYCAAPLGRSPVVRP
jgi:hypothetical protein